jgi:hypothetical protein
MASGSSETMKTSLLIVLLLLIGAALGWLLSAPNGGSPVDRSPVVTSSRGRVVAKQTGAVSKNRLKGMLDLWASLSRRRQ